MSQKFASSLLLRPPQGCYVCYPPKTMCLSLRSCHIHIFLLPNTSLSFLFVLSLRVSRIRGQQCNKVDCVLVQHFILLFVQLLYCLHWGSLQTTAPSQTGERLVQLLPPAQENQTYPAAMVNTVFLSIYQSLHLEIVTREVFFQPWWVIAGTLVSTLIKRSFRSYISKVVMNSG